MTGSNVINVLKVLKGWGRSDPPPPPPTQPQTHTLLVTDNRRSRLDSPFCVIIQHRKFEFGHHSQSKKISNAQELTMQLSQTLSSAIAKIKVSNSPITNHTKKILPQRPPPFFQFLYNLKIHFFVDCFNGGSAFRLFLPLHAVVVEERFWGFNWCIPFIRGVLPRKILENLGCRKSHLLHFWG